MQTRTYMGFWLANSGLTKTPCQLQTLPFTEIRSTREKTLKLSKKITHFVYHYHFCGNKIGTLAFFIVLQKK